MTRKTSAGRSRQGVQRRSTPYLALFWFLVSIFLAVCVGTFSARDWPNPHVYPHPEAAHNACGRVGAYLAYHSIYYLGAGVYPLIVFCIAGSLIWMKRGYLDQKVQRAFGMAVLSAVAASSFHLLHPESVASLPLGYSGVLGFFLGTLMNENFSKFGSILVLAYCSLAGLLFTIDGFWNWILRCIGHTIRAGVVACVGARTASVAVATASSGLVRRIHDSPRQAKATLNQRPAEAVGLFAQLAGSARRWWDTYVAQPRPTETTEAQNRDRHPPRAAATTPIATPGDAPTGKIDVRPKSMPSTPLIRHLQPVQETPEGCYPAVLDDWVLPPMSLLEDTEYSFASQHEHVAREKARILENTLRDFRIEAPVVEIDTGPVITMFELNLAPGVKVSQISALANDIARALRAPAVRVVAPIPGKNTVGIEVPRIDRERVRLKELINVTGHRAKDMKLPLFLGKDASGNCLVYDLAGMPHLLIAGTTGSGKSVCINSVIMSLLMTQRPDRVKLILVDPKMVELSTFKDVPHLMAPIITDMHRAAQILEWACTKMDERYALLAEAGVRNIASYNRLTREEIIERFAPSDSEEQNKLPMHLPYIVMIIDELADLMMNSKDVEHHLARLAQKSRAVGIHLVVATQRPEARVVTGLIKSNLPCRVAFRVAARMDSRIVLDQNGAEVLLGQGDMLFLPPGTAQLLRAQGTFISDAEIRSAVQDLRGKGNCDFHPELMRLRATSGAESGQRDEHFDEAVRIVLETQRGSVSLLQRRLTVGYSRASRLIDQMAEAGIVGEYKGSQAREVLMTVEEWDALKRSVEQDLSAGYQADEQDDEDDAGALEDNSVQS